jgi:hypothetical protein
MVHSSATIQCDPMSHHPDIEMSDIPSPADEHHGPDPQTQQEHLAHQNRTLSSRRVDNSASHDAAAPHQFRDQQSQVLPHSRLMIVFPVLALAQFTAYLDQTSISAAVPAIGDALGLGPSLPWVATSYLLATTAVQLANGRLSDIFGRKRSLIASLSLLAIGNLVTGFATTPGMLFAFRAVSGLGGGAM